MTLTFGSLFAGIGGIDLGLERAGMRCEWQVEIDDYATRVLAKHWPNVPRYRDVRACGADNLSRVDLIAGGFPCQDISDAGQRRGLAGSRSGLWSEFARIIRELRPRYVLVENVAALLHRGVESVLGELAALGYDAEWQCIPAAAIGAPHLRNRLFIVAYADSQRQSQRSGNVAQKRRRAGDGREATLVYPDRNTTRRESQSTDEAAGRGLPYLSERFSGGRGSWRIEPDVDRVAHGVPARVDRLRGLGNAVVPQAAEYVGRLIQEHAHAD
jgi:DNA (cytosine-5)-methyltransferase 1